MGGGIGADYLRAVAAACAQPTADLELIATMATVLADRLALTERAQHGDDGVGMGWTEFRVGMDGGLEIVDRGPNWDPPEAA